jgi:hypothetical protein
LAVFYDSFYLSFTGSSKAQAKSCFLTSLEELIVCYISYIASLRILSFLLVLSIVKSIAFTVTAATFSVTTSGNEFIVKVFNISSVSLLRLFSLSRKVVRPYFS